MKVWNHSHGSASVFLMIVMSAILFVQLVLVDFAMLHVARVRAQHAADAALRSVYAGFDSELHRYGLYGVPYDPEDQTQVFVETLNKNISEDQWVHDQTKLEHAAFLSEDDVFRYQVLEEMKYRAPIEFTLSVLDKWQDTDMASEVQQSKQLSQKLKTIEDILEKRSASLNRAADEFRQLVNGTIHQWHHENQQVHEKLEDKANTIEEHSKQAIQQSIQRLRDDIDRLEDRLADLDSSTDQEEEDVEQSQNKEASKIKEQIQDKKSEIKELEAILDAFVEFATLVTEHEASLKLKQQILQSQLASLSGHLQDARTWNRKAAEEAENLDEDLEQMVFLHDDAVYAKWLSLSGEIEGRFAGYNIQFDAEKFLQGEDFLEKHRSLEELNDSFLNTAVRGYSDFSSWYEQQQAKVDQTEEKKRELTKDAEDSLQKGLALATSCLGDYTLTYQLLQERLNRYKQGDETESEQSESEQDPEWEDPEQAAFNAFDLFETLQAMLLSGRDRAYLNEYVLSKFNYRTMEQSTELSNPNDHPLLNQEVEYVLYGWNSCHLNHSSAYGEMFLLRLAVRTTEQLLSPERSALSFGSPWLVFLWAVAEGAAKAVKDMEKLIDGQELEVSSRLPSVITMNYKDYLRLFMFLHGHEPSMQARVKALIDLNTDVDLRERAVLSEAEAMITYQPIILPAKSGWFGFDADGEHLLIPVHTALAY